MSSLLDRKTMRLRWGLTQEIESDGTNTVICAPNGRQLTSQTPGLQLVLGWVVMEGVCAILHQVSSMLYNIGAYKSQATDSSGVSQNTALPCLVVVGV